MMKGGFFGTIDKLGMNFEIALTNFFTELGTLFARYPLPVIILSVGFAVGLSTGIRSLDVTTDPIELWASPTSRSRIEKDFFDQTFVPFYRTEQVIIKAKNLESFNFVDFRGVNSTFGPIFHKDEFLLPLLDLQEQIKGLTAEFWNGTATIEVSLTDVCNNPLSRPDRPNEHCNIQSIWSYWQDKAENLAPKTNLLNVTMTYLDHFIECSGNPTATPESTVAGQECMSSGGLPMFPFVVLGGFLPEGTQGFPKNPKYSEANAVVMTFLVNNHDAKSDDLLTTMALDKAKAWEKKFVEFMKEWTSNENNTEFMDVAYNSERSIEDELDRETYGDIMTIAVSYIFMFIYITFSLGKLSKLDRFAIESKVSLF